MKLNQSQKEAIDTKDGYILVLAGAGTGKTTTIVERIVELVKNKGIKSDSILAITFTNKAAKELQLRIKKSLGQDCDLTASTFHSFCAKILKNEVANTPYKANYNIISENESRNIIKKVIKDNQSKLQFADIYQMIKQAKQENYTEKEFLKEFESEEGAMLYKEYQKTLQLYNTMDFDDLINNTIKLFSKNKKVLEKYQKQYRYIHVDEYQDTSKTQNQVIEMLASKYNNLFVVGDDDQSIYSWRGADIDGILKFDLKNNANVIKLEENYRSTKSIINFANNIIKNNSERHDKELRTKNKEGKLVTIHTYENEYQEAKIISEKIAKLIESGVNENNIAILYRINKYAKNIEEAFERKNLKYKVIQGQKFYERREVQDIIAYLKLVYNNNDNLSYNKIINTPKKKMGPIAIKKIEEIAKKKKVSNLIASKDHPSPEVRDFVEIILKYKPIIQEDIPKGILKLMKDLNYENYLKESFIISEVTEKMENISTFIEGIKMQIRSSPDFNLETYLADLELDTNTKKTSKGINLMTIHGAKGLEFQHVFIIGVRNGIFPYTDSNVEEERRLLYVASTRAKNTLTISFPIKSNYKPTQISPFLADVPEELIEYYDVYGKKALNSTVKIMKKTSLKFEKGSETFAKGEQIKHKKLGIGTIKKVHKEGYISIEFLDGSERTIIPAAKIITKVNK